VRTFKGRVYSYARRQAYREFSKAYRGYKNSNHNTYTKNTNSNSDGSFAAIFCIYGFIVMMLFFSWITN
jgi:hypothetical protein